jgi:hypothetical protein
MQEALAIGKPAYDAQWDRFAKKAMFKEVKVDTILTLFTLKNRTTWNDDGEGRDFTESETTTLEFDDTDV